MNFKLLNTVSYVIETTPGLVSLMWASWVWKLLCERVWVCVRWEDVSVRCVCVRACVVTRVDGTCVCARVRVGARVRSHQHGLAEVGWHG